MLNNVFNAVCNQIGTWIQYSCTVSIPVQMFLKHVFLMNAKFIKDPMN